MDTQFPASVIADWYLQKDKSMKEDVMKVLKLVYISHGFYLALTDNPLIKEGVQAWQYGPVIPELYFQLKVDRLVYDMEIKKSFDSNADIHKLLDFVYNKYGKCNGFDLSNLTHQKGTPWDLTVNNFESLITNDIIKDHYKTIMAG